MTAEITAYNHGREDAMGDLGDRLARVTAQRDRMLSTLRGLNEWQFYMGGFEAKIWRELERTLAIATAEEEK